MIALILFLLTLSIASAALFDPFILNASSTGYIINGTYKQNLQRLSTPATLVIDGPNNRYLFDFGYLGKYHVDATGSYVFDQINFPGMCRKIIASNFATEYAGFEQAVAVNDKENKAKYFGTIEVGTGCGYPIGFSTETTDDIIMTIEFGIRISGPFGPGNSTICFPLVIVLEMKMSTLDTKSNRDAYFNLPASCSTPIDFCYTEYPPGNPCYN